MAIVFALRYDNLITELRVWVLILFSWLLSILIGTLSAFIYKVNSTNLWSCNLTPIKENIQFSFEGSNDTNIDHKFVTEKQFQKSQQGIHKSFDSTEFSSIDLVPCTYPDCENNVVHSQYKSDVFAMGVFFLVFLIPSLLLTIIYGRIYVEAHNNSKVCVNFW